MVGGVSANGVAAGAHILSGGVLDTRALNELYPKADPDDDEFAWQTLGAPVNDRVTRQTLSLLTARRRWWLPLFRGMRDKGSYVADLGCAARPPFAAAGAAAQPL